MYQGATRLAGRVSWGDAARRSGRRSRVRRSACSDGWGAAVLRISTVAVLSEGHRKGRAFLAFCGGRATRSGAVFLGYLWKVFGGVVGPGEWWPLDRGRARSSRLLSPSPCLRLMTPSNTPTLPPLPKSWPTHTKAALVHVHALARIVFGLALGDAAQNLGATVTCPNCERLHSEVALSEEHLALIHSRFSRTPQRKRSRFSPPERLRALTLMASRGWSRAQAANALLVEPPTVSRWLAWARDDSPRL